MSEERVTLTRQQIEDWRGWAKDGHTMEFGKILNAKFITLCDLALSALDREAVLEEPWAWAVHQDGGEFDYLVYPNREDADRDADIHEKETIPLYPLRALKREPNAAAQAGQGFSSAPSHEGHAAGPAPAAPDVASMVKQAEQNAQYWLKAGYEEPHRDLAVLNVEQAMNAYKNAMYALLARLGQGWIPVSERLPECDEVVIVQGGIARHNGKEWKTLTCEPWPGRPIQWKVTHWMSLPKAPGASSTTTIKNRYDQDPDGVPGASDD